MSSTYIPPLVEQAAATLLAAQTFAQQDEDGIKLDATRILKGFQRAATVDEEQKIPVPCVICSCVTANDEQDFASGNWVAELIVEMRSKVFDTSSAQHQAMAEEVFSFFYDTTIAASLTAALTGFTAFLVVPQEPARAVENNNWLSRARFLVHCCGSDIS